MWGEELLGITQSLEEKEIRWLELSVWNINQGICYNDWSVEQIQMI
jgi:hypothetical protein